MLGENFQIYKVQITVNPHVDRPPSHKYAQKSLSPMKSFFLKNVPPYFTEAPCVAEKILFVTVALPKIYSFLSVSCGLTGLTYLNITLSECHMRHVCVSHPFLSFFLVNDIHFKFVLVIRASFFFYHYHLYHQHHHQFQYF